MEKKLTRAEELSLKAYPICPSCLSETNGDGDRNYPRRLAFIEGYEQAEKDIIEWIDEQLAILDKQTLLHPDDDVFWGQRNAYKQMKDKLNSL